MMNSLYAIDIRSIDAFLLENFLCYYHDSGANGISHLELSVKSAASQSTHRAGRTER